MHYIKKTGQFDSSNGTHKIHYYVYTPVQEPRAVLQLSHGMCEYLERYEPFASFLTRNGVLLCGSDHLGHGKSAGSLENLGYFAEKDGWKCLVEDQYRLTQTIKAHYAGLPYFLFGHSMGSFIARAYLTKYASQLDGALICGTSGGEKLGGLGIALTGRIMRSKGPFYRSAKLQDLAFGQYNKRYEDAKTDFDWLTRDESIVHRYMHDPYCNFVFTASGFRDLFTLLKFVSRRRWAYAIPKDLPVLLLSGDMDPVGDYGRGVRKVYERLQKAGLDDVRLKLYPGARHEILNETNCKEVYADVLAWIENVL
ncbi:alpha/beta fold hydrolase [Candidatus Soleaferrea massiliensis]|uniref:alpha/beta fold hydrolase n=1 Tax=Candidatus Soleaferrea massiliensis TaxID=1470354 RepID=UPI00058C98CA|nr:alpha/beta fold hydrolase [Candidatus Soleaferrea massiliensis]